MSKTVSEVIIAAPINRSVELEHSADELLGYMERSFPGIEFVLDLKSPIRHPDQFGLLPVAGTAGDAKKPGQMFKPLSQAMMMEMYEALERYDPKPALN